jgi:hypothetical protein|uniref:Uncharacterized protein n=1 Tax=viral metagenome TaxID=1070528 RepID=A0A6C0JFX9_9ZZZZ
MVYKGCSQTTNNSQTYECPEKVEFDKNSNSRNESTAIYLAQRIQRTGGTIRFIQQPVNAFQSRGGASGGSGVALKNKF